MSVDVVKPDPVKRDVASMDEPAARQATRTWPSNPHLLLAFIVGCMTLLVAVPTTAYRIAESGYLNNVSGVWATLADDLRHGTLYRPILSELGYGGTRYFPLHIVLHGALAWLGVPLIVGGHLISVLAGAVLVSGAYVALRAGGASTRPALCLAPVVLASRTVFMGLAGIRGDLLPVALAVLGLALVPKDERRSAPIAAGILIGLAFLAKQTVLWAAAAAFMALLLAGRRRDALSFAGIVGGVGLLGLGLAYWASDGAMLASFRAFSSGGGVSPSKLYKTLLYFRPGELLLIFGGFSLCIARWRDSLKDPVRASMLVVVPFTVLLFSAEGTHVNHLVDASSMGALTLALGVGTPQRWGRRLFAVSVSCSLTEAFLLDGMELRRGDLAAAAAALPPGKGPVLADQPWIPLLAGERPFLLDSFNVAARNEWGRRLQSDLAARIERCEFRAIVLSWRAELIENPLFFKERFGQGFREQLLTHYSIAHVSGAHAFYLPSCGKSNVPAPPPGALPETVSERFVRAGRFRTLLLEIFRPDDP